VPTDQPANGPETGATQTRLFTALWPSPQAVDALAADLAAVPQEWPPEGWRAVPPSRWHLTLCFHGDADPGTLARQLEQRAAGCVAPRLRLAGAGFLPRVAFARVVGADPSDDAALAELVAAAGATPDGFLPHVTVARARRGRAWPTSGGPLHRHRGPWWQPSEVHLVSSEQGQGPVRYRVQHRVPLLTTAPGPPVSAAGW
jgi:2'-5' RNA ligase